MARDLVGDTAEDESLDAPVTMASHHHEVGRGRERENLFGRIAKGHERVDSAALLAQGCGDRLQIRLTVSRGRAHRRKIGPITLNGQETHPFARQQFDVGQRRFRGFRSIERDQDPFVHTHAPPCLVSDGDIAGDS